ncbi:MAG: glycosyltransferase family protein [Deltaproteobacteria bacterium]
MSRRVIIVQARMASVRLPGKVLMDLCGKPMLSRQLARLRRCRYADEIVVATTDRRIDDPVVDLATREGFRCFRGSESDVLSRYRGAARESRADLVVRITADCPLIDPAQTDRVIRALDEGATGYDYASNTLERRFPRGLDTEALFADVLERVHRMATSPSAREHVTSFIHRERPELFRLLSVTDEEDHSDLRWTVDEPEDLLFVRKVYEELGDAVVEAGYRELLAFVLERPDLVALNRGVVQKPV